MSASCSQRLQARDRASYTSMFPRRLFPSPQSISSIANNGDLMREVVIVSAARTPVGKFLGALSHLSAVELGSIAVRAAVERSAINSADVTECIMGCVLPAALGQNPARQAALRRGLPDSSSALTINIA